MARFPKTEAEVRTLAQHIITGLPGNPDFPSPPVAANNLEDLLTAFSTRSDIRVAAQATAQQATEAKHTAFDDLTLAMISVLRYAENTVHGNDAKLAALGWSGKAAPTSLDAPGQPRSLEAPHQGWGWLILDWKPPAEGGAVASYKIERRQLPGETWETVGMSLETEMTLNNQERSKEWEYRVIAVNKAGEGAPSNTAAAVL